ncbi:MAG TPA: TonB-dependent receptor [Terriglobales bacterium]|nr:TonB-dependent receptor [Terriglobales bacterium]
MFGVAFKGRAYPHSSTVQQIITTLVMLALLSFANGTFAQVLYGSLTGAVTDASGAVVTGSQVTVLEVQTGVTRDATTDSSGIYRFATLFPGTYKVTITAPGFSTQETPGVRVAANEIARVDAQLGVASATQNVTVTAEAPILQTDKADVHTDLTAQQIESLPDAGSQGRNFQALLRLIPGVGLTAETNSLAGNPQRAINANVNGQSQQGVNTRLDGAQDAYPWLPSNVAYVPPADAIESVNVVTNSFDAEQGLAGGAAVNVQIKSGTNQFHGSGHELYTGQLFAARNYFNTDPKIFPTKNKNIQHQFGGALGGPILKNKLFFFGDYERTTQRQLAGPDTATLPTAAMAAGDFRNLPGNPIIYDPATGTATGSGKQQVSCNGVLNVICPNRIDPAATKMIALLQPAITRVFATANDQGNFVGSGTALFNRDTADIKVNYVPGEKSTLFARYSFSKTFVFDPPLLGAADGNATNGGQLGNAPGLIQSVGLGATYAFTPSVLLDWNFGFTRQRLGSTFDLTAAKGISDLGIPGTNNAGTTGDPSLYYGLPGFIFPTAQPGSGTGNQIGTPIGNAQPANPFLFRDQQFVSGANLSWIKGKHALRGGIEWNHSQINHFQPQGGTLQSPRGVFGFNGDVTSQFGTTPTWFNSWADFLLGLPTVTGKGFQIFNPNALRWSQWAWYLRDEWQVTPKLTLTLGVRWEYYPFGYSDNNKGLRYFDLNTGNVLIGGYGSVPQNDGIDVGIGEFLPRVGLAYRLTPSTVFRAGYGMSADPNNWRYFRTTYPSVILATNVAANTANFIPAASLTGLNGTGLGGGSYSVQTGILLPPLPNISSGSIPLPTNVGTTTIHNPFRRGYTNSFNLMVEQEWKGIVLDTGYVGARGIRPLVNLNANASLPGTGSAGGLLSQALGQNYTGTINALTPFKNSYYDSLQTKVTHRFTNGSTAGFAWTWSKTTDYEDNEELSSLAFPDPAFFAKDRAVAGYDRTHDIEIYAVLRLPFGKDQLWAKTGPGSWFLGGWQLSPVISRLSGVPFTVGAGGSLNANGSGQTADLVGNFHILNGRPPRTGQTCAQTDLSCHYFDPSIFAAPLITSSANAHYGNTNRNEFRGPGYFTTSLSLAREFRLTERFRLQIRADTFSLTNTPHFANPNLSCPGNAAVAGSIPGEGGLCNTGSNNNFGVITSAAQPGGFFGPDPGNRTIWFGASVKF